MNKQEWLRQEVERFSKPFQEYDVGEVIYDVNAYLSEAKRYCKELNEFIKIAETYKEMKND